MCLHSAFCFEREKNQARQRYWWRDEIKKVALTMFLDRTICLSDIVGLNVMCAFSLASGST